MLEVFDNCAQRVGPMKPVKLRERLDECAAALREAGVRVTPQRLAIFEAAVHAAGHPDVETVFGAVRRRLPTVSLDTVYRTLHLFAEVGLLSLVGQSGERTRFDTNTRPHHHFVCTCCGAMQDFEAAAYDGLDLPPPAAGLGRVQSAHVELRGLCSRCAKTRGKNCR